MMRVLVTGGRDYHDGEAAFSILDALHRKHSFALVIHGGARGADMLAKQWAQSRDCRCRAFVADWKTLGKAAGPIRNQRMIDEGHPDLVVAFHGGRGTADMVHRARASGVEVIEVSASPSRKK